jgi:hypothetical protein
MKKINLYYWIVTGLFAAFMMLSGIPNIISTPESVTMVSQQLGYPAYIIPFLGVAKVLGAIAILIPGYPRIKEWAYAGLVFDLLGATYSVFAIGMVDASVAFMILPFSLAFGSYFLYHKKLKAAAVV